MSTPKPGHEVVAKADMHARAAHVALTSGGDPMIAIAHALTSLAYTHLNPPPRRRFVPRRESFVRQVDLTEEVGA